MSLKPSTFYTNSGLMMKLFEVEDNEVLKFQTAIDELENQFSISTATHTIERWEKELGLPKSNLPLEQRRQTVKAKLRGYGTVTVSLVKAVCDSYTNGDVSIIERHGDYEFDIKFNSIRGIPANLDDLKSIINQLKPAHLGVNYIILYTTWDRFDSFNYTWDQIDALNKTWNEIEVI